MLRIKWSNPGMLSSEVAIYFAEPTHSIPYIDSLNRYIAYT